MRSELICIVMSTLMHLMSAMPVVLVAFVIITITIKFTYNLASV